MTAETQRDARDNMNNRPDTHPAEVKLSAVAAFVRTVALLLEPQSSYSTSRLTIVLGKYVDWAHGVRGLPLAERLIFDTQVIDLYIRDSIARKKLAKSSVAAYRSMLLRASEMFLPRDDAADARGLGATRMLPPYDATEIDQFPNWARGQRTELMRDKATALMCLGLGCGLHARDINSLRREDVEDGDGIIVTVLSPSGVRRVPMLPRYHRAFRGLIESRDAGDFVFGQRERSVKANAISEFVADSSWHHVKPSTYRMRTTWVVGRLVAGTDLPTLLEAAGLQRLEKLGDYLPYLAKPTDATFAGLTKEVSR